MTQDSHNLMNCGDGPYCRECALLALAQQRRDGAAYRFSRNAMGRCDMYIGPSIVCKEVRVPKSAYYETRCA